MESHRTVRTYATGHYSVLAQIGENISVGETARAYVSVQTAQILLSLWMLPSTSHPCDASASKHSCAATGLLDLVLRDFTAYTHFHDILQAQVACLKTNRGHIPARLEFSLPEKTPDTAGYAA